MIDQSKLFSVLIANYNNEHFIGETLESVKRQSYENLEIIIVDDASTDDSITTIKVHQKLDNRIKLFLNKKNKGCGFTKNRCVELSTGQFCGFVDPEDTISIDAIESMVQDHQNNPSVSLVFSNSYHCDNELNILRLRKPNKPEGLMKISQMYEQNITHFSTFKKSSYLKTNGINPNILRAVDQDLYLKLEEVGNVFYRNKNLYFYRYHDKGISAYGNKYKALYWFYYVKNEACERRKIKKEEYFSEDFQKLIEKEKNSPDFKIGHSILKPIRYLISNYRKIYFRYRN